MNVIGIVSVLACVLAMPALAQKYPAKPIRMIVGIAAGGGVDTGARAVAAALFPLLGQQVVVENRVGAGGNIGAAVAADAAPDGYTLLYGETSVLIAPSLYQKLSFDPVKSFAAVGAVGWEPLVLSVNPALPAKSAAELIALLKATPGKHSYGSPGIGSPHHLSMEMIRKQAGVDIVHVPYKGAALVVPDLISGVLSVAMMSAATTLPQAKSGKIRALAVSTSVRLPSAPDWPPLAETLPGFEAMATHFIVAPVGVSAEVIGRLSDALKTALAGEDMKRSFASRGATAEYAPPDVLAARIRTQVQKWGTIAKESGAKLE